MLIRQTGGEFSRFFVVGVGATIIHLGVYLLLNSVFGIDAENSLAFSITYAIGYAVSFILNYIVTLRWTFRTSGSVSKGAGFALSHIINAAMHLLLLNVFSSIGTGQALSSIVCTLLPFFVERFPIISQPENLLPLPVYLIVVPLNFFMVRFFLKRGD